MDLKDRLRSEALRLVAHPTVAQLMQDERFTRLFVAALSVPGRINEITEEQRQSFIRLMGLATAEEVADLRRTIRALEDEVSRLRGSDRR